MTERFQTHADIPRHVRDTLPVSETSGEKKKENVLRAGRNRRGCEREGDYRKFPRFALRVPSINFQINRDRR